MSADAPYTYVRDYYRQDCDRWDRFPEINTFMNRFFSRVAGETVLNPGCGPQFYDYFLRLGTTPRKYVGVDIGPATVEFLRHEGEDERFVRAREAQKSFGASGGSSLVSIAIRSPTRVARDSLRQRKWATRSTLSRESWTHSTDWRTTTPWSAPFWSASIPSREIPQRRRC